MSDPASLADRRLPPGPAHLGTVGLVWERDPAPTASKHELDEEHLGSWPALLLSKVSASARATEQTGHVAAFRGSSEVQAGAPLPCAHGRSP